MLLLLLLLLLLQFLKSFLSFLLGKERTTWGLRLRSKIGHAVSQRPHLFDSSKCWPQKKAKKKTRPTLSSCFKLIDANLSKKSGHTLWRHVKKKCPVYFRTQVSVALHGCPLRAHAHTPTACLLAPLLS